MTTPPPHTYRLGVLLGDGIGPEIVPSSVAIVDAAVKAAGVDPIDWRELPLGASAIEEHGSHTPETTLKALDDLDGWLLGPHDSASYPEPFRSQLNPSGTIRKHFGLYANIRPAKSFEGGNAVVEGTDLVIARENTEGFYADRNTFRGTGEMMPTPDVAIMHGIITRAATEKIAHSAFQLAQRRRNKVTIVHKANVLKMTTGLFRDVCREVAQQYPGVELDDFHIDAMTVHLVRRANAFDVIVTENMFGDILSDLAGEIAGSLGIAPSLNSSDTHAMAQAAHGSAPDIAGQDLANPIAMNLSSGMLLDWLGSRHDDPRLNDAARRLEEGVADTVRSGVSTRDLGGNASCSEFTAAVVASHRVRGVIVHGVILPKTERQAMDHTEPVVAVIHATAATMSPVAHAFADAFPDAEVWHLLDDRLVKEADRAGGLTQALQGRMNSLIAYAVDGGADAVQLACSMYGPVASASRQPVPVLASDEAMFDAVVALAPRRIGIIASLGPSAEDSAARLGEAISEGGHEAVIETMVVPEAVAAAAAGDLGLLAQLLGDAAVKLGEVDVIVLAQYSLSPVAASVAERVSAPVLSGPHLAASRLGAELVGSRS